MKTKKISLPTPINFPWLVSFLQSRAGVITTNWISQAMRHMSPSERLHRLFFEGLCFLGLLYALSSVMNTTLAVVLALFLAHTLFFIFNGQVYTLKRYLSDNLIGAEEFISHIEQMYPGLQNHSCLDAVVAFGSLSKEPPSGSSDFDVRLIRKKGFWNAFCAANICTRERYRAFWNKFPIDIIVATMEELHMAEDEPAIILFDPHNLFKSYPAGAEAYDQFIARIKGSK